MAIPSHIVQQSSKQPNAFWLHIPNADVRMANPSSPIEWSYNGQYECAHSQLHRSATRLYSYYGELPWVSYVAAVSICTTRIEMRLVSNTIRLPHHASPMPAQLPMWLTYWNMRRDTAQTTTKQQNVAFIPFPQEKRGAQGSES